MGHRKGRKLGWRKKGNLQELLSFSHHKYHIPVLNVCFKLEHGSIDRAKTKMSQSEKRSEKSELKKKVKTRFSSIGMYI